MAVNKTTHGADRITHGYGPVLKKVIILMLVTSVLLISQTGCWNSREINELAFVLSIALDKDDDGFKVTAQIAKPDVFSKTPSGGSSGTEKEKPFWVVSGKGKTIFEAVRDMSEISSRRIFWPHIKVIIISEALASEDILEIFDFFSRNPELRLRTWIAVTEGEAGKILEVMPLMEKDPSVNIEKIIDKSNLSGKAYKIMLKNFLEEYLDPYVDPVASKLSITTVNERPSIELSGAAVFRNSNMVGWLNEVETRGLLWFKKQIGGSIKVVDCPYDKKPVTLEIKSGKADIKSYIKDGVPGFVITATVKGKLTEKSCTTDFNNAETISALEKAFSSAIMTDIESAVAASKKYDSDFLNLTRILQIQHKKEWDKISANWPGLLKEANVEIKVKSDIPEVSLLAKSLTPRKSE